jgi:hypothetical protein
VDYIKYGEDKNLKEKITWKTHNLEEEAKNIKKEL